jgi:hypothetical protein
VHNKNCAVYDTIPLLSTINIRYELRGRKWTNREGKEVLIESKLAFHMEIIKNPMSPQVPVQVPAQTPAPAPATVTDSDDLPF